MGISVDWEVVLEPYEKDSQCAHNLAMLFYDLIQANRAGKHRLITRTLYEGIKEIYPFTKECREGFKLYYLFLSGELAPEYEPDRVYERVFESKEVV